MNCEEWLGEIIYTIYNENNLFQLFWVDFFSFKKCPQFSIQITHVTNI